MGNLIKEVILGKDYQAQNEVYTGSFESQHIAWGTSAGVTMKPNEDAVGLSVLGAEVVLAVADGHWGKDASEIAVSKAVELLNPNVRPSKDSETRARLFALFDQVNIELYELATSSPGASASETTLIVCHFKETLEGKYLYWASFGDSYLFLLRTGELQQLNTLQPFWLGYLSRLSESASSRSILMRFLSEEARYVGVASGLETGIQKLEPGDLIFLCTDGLIGSDYEPEQAILDELRAILISNVPVKSKAEKMIASALRRGEQDNISCVLAQI